jgi:hypothetical protein
VTTATDPSRGATEGADTDTESTGRAGHAARAGRDPVSADDRARRRAAWRWASLFVAGYLLLGVGWAFSNPPAAAPDEHHHLIKAIGMGRLDIGDEYDEPLPDEPLLVRRNLSITRLVEIPASLDPEAYPCYAFRGERTAACMPDAAPTGAGTVVRATPIGAYPPFAYVPMGVAARATDTPIRAFYAARLVALTTAAAVLFVGAWFLVRGIGPAALLGALLALTPMAVFAAASVTTSGLEIASGFTIGAIATVCLRRPGTLARPGTQYALAGVGSVLVLSRQMGVVTLGVLLAVLVIACWREMVQVVREHRAPFVTSVALLAAATVAVALWELAYDHPADTGLPFRPSVADDFLAQGEGLARSAVGMFGWLDAPLPGWAVVAWIAAAVVLGVLALAVGDRRDRLVLGTVLGATVVVSFATYASVFYPVGADAQGRHLLPLLAFCPTFAGAVLADRLSGGDDDRRSLPTSVPSTAMAAGSGSSPAVTTPAAAPPAAATPAAVTAGVVAIAVVVGVVQVAGLYANARRYAVGTSGPVLFLGDAEWDPSLGWVPWLATGLVGAALLAVVAVAGRPGRASHPATGDT